jgi:Zn-dependent protease with chaperone function
LTLTAGVALQALTPVLNAISRNYVEHRADTYALNLTRNREAFIGAMEKLARMNLANPNPSALVKYALYSHPPVGERIAYGRSFHPEN